VGAVQEEDVLPSGGVGVGGVDGPCTEEVGGGVGALGDLGLDVDVGLVDRPEGFTFVRGRGGVQEPLPPSRLACLGFALRHPCVHAPEQRQNNTTKKIVCKIFDGSLSFGCGVSLEKSREFGQYALLFGSDLNIQN